MGPYESREEAQKERDKMSNLGAICTEPVEKPDDYELYKGREK